MKTEEKEQHLRKTPHECQAVLRNIKNDFKKKKAFQQLLYIYSCELPIFSRYNKNLFQNVFFNTIFFTL